MDKQDNPSGTGIVNRAGTSAALLAGAVFACQPPPATQESASGVARGVSRGGTGAAAPVPPETRALLPEQERIVFDGRSPYSHLQVIDSGSTRTLVFMHDDGAKVVQSRYRLDAPDLLEVAYTRAMFASLLFRRAQQRCLIVGLGGGSMVRFLRRFFPEVAIDAVEIDPLVVQVAAEYFQVEATERVRIVTADAYEFVARSHELYDVIYLDAFLKVSGETDSTGVPLELRTLEFLGSLRQRLRANGLVVSNIHQRLSTPRDIETLGTGFPSVYVFPVPGTGNTIVVSSLAARRLDRAELERRGRVLDRHAEYGFSFEGVAKTLAP